ncbi:MAG TPA: hypothetical protein VGJ48_16135 [Pyrinomonadaceae bacterium]
MITGFNTDIEHEGVVYHVQTEDKGLDSPLILSLVYVGGEVLASKRSRYEDLILSGFDEEVLGQRLKRQHRLICAAINAGRLEELKRMSARVEEDVTLSVVTQAVPPVTEEEEGQEISEAGATVVDEDPTIEERSATSETTAVPEASEEESRKPRTRRRLRAKESVYTVYDPRRQPSPLGEAPDKETPVVLTILDDDEFRAGESFTIRVLVEDGTGNEQKPLMGVSVSVKILGTTFRPQIYSVRTERDGVAAVSTTMPNFTSGRAAVLIRAVANGETTELRRVIHPAQ